MLSEINDMPQKAYDFLNNSGEYKLPTGVPYIGMGSSYFAPLAFKYMGIDIYPELASEYAIYLNAGKQKPYGVLLSQSGRSTEVLWCRELFKKYAAVSNDPKSALCSLPIADKIIPLWAGEEKFSSSKTYVNTLIALFKGFGMNVEKTVNLLSEQMELYNQQGKALADDVYQLLLQNKVSSLYITGSGPNIATAMQAALIMSETTKLNFNGLPMAQYDHGPKETAKNSIVINITAKGKSYNRTIQLTKTIKAAGANVHTIEEARVSENESIVTNIIPFNYMAYYLSQKLNVQETFVVGGKVTEFNPVDKIE